MGNAVNKDTPCLIVDSIKHPVITDSETVALFSLKFFSTGRAGIRLQGKDPIANTLVDFIGQAVHLFLCRPLDLSCVAHLRLPFSRFQVVTERARWLRSSLLDSGEIDQIVAEISILDEAQDDKLSVPLWKGSDSS